MPNVEEIILATSSQHRILGFQQLGLPFRSEASNVQEDDPNRPKSPRDLALYLARIKAETVAKKYPSGLVLGFDSVGWFDGHILEKPRSIDEARARLHALSNRRHKLFTGVHGISASRAISTSRYAITEVTFRTLSPEEIDAYLVQDQELMTRALGYSPGSNLSCSFVSKVEGNMPHLLYGLPLDLIPELLQHLGYQPPI